MNRIMMELLPAIPAPSGANLPVEYQENPPAYLCSRLTQLASISGAQKEYLTAVLAALRVTESGAECEVVQRLLNRLPLRN